MEDWNRDKIILFHTGSCHKCPEAVGLVEEIANELGTEKLYFGKLNVAKNESMKITTIPSLVFFPYDNPQKMDFF